MDEPIIKEFSICKCGRIFSVKADQFFRDYQPHYFKYCLICQIKKMELEEFENKK